VTSSLQQVANSTGNVQQTATSLKAQTNTTVNSTMTSSLVQVSNSTSTANLSAVALIIGTTVVNSTVVAVGSNNFVNTTALDIGNTVVTSVNLTLGGQVTANASVGTAGQVLTSGAAGNAYWSTAVGGGYYKGGAAAVGSLAAQGQNIFRVNANTLNVNTTFVAGENGQATGPLTVAAGITLTVQTGARVSIV
jgi:hypothetical protein